MKTSLCLLLVVSFLGLLVRPTQAACTALSFVNGTTCTFCSNPSDNACVGCDGVSSHHPLTIDVCGVCGGSASTVGCSDCLGHTSGTLQNYDECGVCAGDGSSCSGAARTVDVTFYPADTPSSGLIYKFPLTVFFTTTTADASIYYDIQVTNNTNSDQKPPNMFSPVAASVVITNDVTIKVFAWKNGLRQSTVTSATYQVSETGTEPLPPGLLIPVYAVILIVVGAVLLIVVLAVIIVVVRVNNRNKLVAIRLDESEKDAKESHYRSLYDYEAKNTDEIPLKIGDVILVTKKLDDGWWEGSSYRLKGKTGMFPGNYVEQIPPERLMWVERPKTMIGRMSQRVSNFFGGAPEYGMDPQAAQHSRFSQRVSKMFGVTPSNETNMSRLPPKPQGSLPSRPPPKPSAY